MRQVTLAATVGVQRTIEGRSIDAGEPHSAATRPAGTGRIGLWTRPVQAGAARPTSHAPSSRLTSRGC
jgi:hypothetical protein